LKPGFRSLTEKEANERGFHYLFRLSAAGHRRITGKKSLCRRSAGEAGKFRGTIKGH